MLQIACLSVIDSMTGAEASGRTIRSGFAEACTAPAIGQRSGSGVRQV